MKYFFIKLSTVANGIFIWSQFTFAQNVGVNTDGSSPTELLHVKSTVASGNTLLIEHSLGAQEPALRLLTPTANANWRFYIPASSGELRLSNSGTDRITFLANGNVGIGTSIPAATLDVSGAYSARSSTAAAAAAVVIPNNISLFRLTATGGVQANALSVAAPIAGQYLTIINLDGDAATFAGATIPASNGVGSFVYEGGAWRVISIASGAAGWNLTGNSLAGTEFIGSTNAQPFMIRTNNTDRARILSGGNFLINRTTAVVATDAFEVQGDVTFPDAVNGYTSAVGGNAIFGQNTAGGASTSIVGTIASATGFAIDGYNTNASGTGILGEGNNLAGTYLVGGSGGAFSSTNVGVYGYGNNTAASTGVYGESANSTGTGVYAYNSVANGAAIGFGIFERNNQSGGTGIAANMQSNSYFAGMALSAITANTIANGAGVWGACDNATGVGVGGQSAGATGLGLFGAATNATGTGIAAYGNNAGAFGSPTGSSGAAFSGTRYGAYAYQTNENTSGTGYYWGQNYAGMQGDGGNDGTNNRYHFGIFGDMWVNAAANARRTGGVIGSHEDNNTFNGFGILGYLTSGGTYAGVYGSTNYNGGGGPFGGFMENNNIQTGFGGAFYGGIMGGWMRGDVIGFTSCGELYASYNLGNEYTSGVQAEIVTLNNKRVAAYSLTATDIKIYDDGTAELSNGHAKVYFDEKFAELLGKATPTVTVSPMGKCNGIYITNIDSKGFEVEEQNGGNSNVKFSYIIVGKRIDADKYDFPRDLQAKDFDDKLKGVMFNEADTEHNGTPMWWDGTKIRFDEMPESMEIPNKKQIGPKPSKKLPVSAKKINEVEMDMTKTNKVFLDEHKKKTGEK